MSHDAETPTFQSGRTTAAAYARSKAEQLRRKAKAFDQLADMLIRIEGDFDDGPIWSLICDIQT